MLTAVIALAIVAADQASKWAAIEILSAEPGNRIVVIENFFALTLVYNPGAAFGIFPGFNQLFIVLSIITVVLLLVFFRTFFSGGRLSRAAGGLIIGGAVGNLIDRFRFSQVVDFFDFQFGDYRWPAFNIADSAIVVGVVLLAAAVLLAKSGERIPPGGLVPPEGKFKG